MVDNERINIGLRIRSARKALKITQQELSDRLNISRQSIIDMECGKTSPKSDSLGELSRSLNKPVDWILFGLSTSEIFVSLLSIVEGDEKLQFLEQVKQHLNYLEKEKQKCGEE